MDWDQRLLQQLQRRERTRPILRLYRWQTPTVSLGKNQIANEVVSLAELERLNYGMVKRPTGGRALLHKGDICYAIVANRNSHPFFHSLTSTYRSIGEALSQVIQSLGIALTDLSSKGNNSRKDLSPCFAMVSPFEVTVGGRKICGSAQLRSGDYFLQHGSLRVRDNWNQDDLATIWPAGLALDADKITSVDREIGKRIEFKMIEEQILVAFRNGFQVQFELRSEDEHN